MGVLIGFALSMPNFLSMSQVLHLANEGSPFSLLDLKFKKECENPHHGHLKPICHYFAKLITK
jgi:hypothetical protein